MATLVPAFMPGRLFWAYFVGVAFFAAAGGILYRLMARPAATMLGVMFFLFVILLHIPRIIGKSSDGNEWTSGFVALVSSPWLSWLSGFNILSLGVTRQDWAPLGYLGARSSLISSA